MIPDLTKYRRHLDGADLSDQQKADLLAAVWTIMEGFADAAFGMHPVQQVVARACKFPIGPSNTLELKAAFEHASQFHVTRNNEQEGA